MQVYIGNLIHTKNQDQLEILISQAIGINQCGTIEFIMPSNQYRAEEEDHITHFESHQFLFPGFIDTHVHAPQYPNCGIFGDSTLLDWLNTYTFPLEGQFDNVELASTIYSKLIERQLSSGTTTASYFGSIHVPSTIKLAELCAVKGQRAFVGRVCMQRFCPESLKNCSLSSEVELIDGIRAIDPEFHLVKPIITPRFAPSCQFDTLLGLGELARDENLPIQTHISENLKEIEWVRELFPEASSYADVYDRAKLLKHDTVLAHSIHLSDDERQLIKARESGISHCPNSNASLASGIAPIKEYLDQRIKVGLGTDVSGGSTPSILKNARLALLMSRLLSQWKNSAELVLSIQNVLFIATLGGAQVLNSQQRIGNFEVSKQFDAQLVDILAQDSPIDIFEVATPRDEIEKLFNFVQKWVYIGDDRNTVKVWVNGKLVHSRR